MTKIYEISDSITYFNEMVESFVDSVISFDQVIRQLKKLNSKATEIGFNFPNVEKITLTGDFLQFHLLAKDKLDKFLDKRITHDQILSDLRSINDGASQKSIPMVDYFQLIELIVEINPGYKNFELNEDDIEDEVDS